MPEQWKDVLGGHYQISNLGRLRRAKSRVKGDEGRVLRPSVSRDGYLHMQLSVDGKRIDKLIHILVAEAFYGPCPPGHQVNHRNGVKSDNRPINLQYVTPSRNVRHAIEMGLATIRRGESIGMGVLTEDLVKVIRARVALGSTQAELCREMDLHPMTVNHVVRGRTWKHVT